MYVDSFSYRSTALELSRCEHQEPDPGFRGRFLGIIGPIIGQDPTVSESNRLHVVIFQVFLHLSRVYSPDSSTMMDRFPEALNVRTGYSSNSTSSSVTSSRFFPFIGIISRVSSWVTEVVWIW